MDLKYNKCKKHPEIYWCSIAYRGYCPLCKLEDEVEELNIQLMIADERLKLVLDLKADDFNKKMEEFAKQCELDPTLAKEFLQKTGIYTQDGQLTENFK